MPGEVGWANNPQVLGGTSHAVNLPTGKQSVSIKGWPDTTPRLFLWELVIFCLEMPQYMIGLLGDIHMDTQVTCWVRQFQLALN